MPPTALTISTPIPYNPLRAFSPPPSCFASTYTLAPAGNDTFLSSTVVRGPQAGCFPSEADWAGVTANVTTTSLVTFSPGTCPSGYITVGGGIVAGNASLTIATCCPPPLTLSVDSTQGKAYCQEYGAVRNMVTLVNNSVTSTALAAYLQAIPTIVVWQSSDLEFLRREPSTTSISPQPGSAGSTTPTATSLPVNPASTNPPSGVSVGAQAGIGAAAAVAAILLTALGAILWRRRKTRQTVAASTEDNDGKAELPGEGVHRELGQEAAVYEKDAFSKPAEMVNTERAELETDWTGWEAPAVVEVDLSRPGSLAPETERERSHQDLQALAKRSRTGDGRHEPEARLPSVDMTR